MQSTGRVTDVSPDNVGSNLSIAHAAGATELQVISNSDFDELGGQLVVDDDATIYSYSFGAEFEEYDILLISPALAFAGDAGAPVSTYPAIELKVANVRPDDEDLLIQSEQAGQPFNQIPISPLVADTFPMGPRDGVNGEWVLLDDESGAWEVVRVYGQSGQVPGESISSPVPQEYLSDGIPPDDSPAVTVEPFAVGAVLASWSTNTDNPDPVTYDVYASLTSPVTTASTKVASNLSASSLVISQLAGTQIPMTDPATPVYVRVMERDADGPATGGLGTEGSAAPRLVTNEYVSALYAYLGTIQAGQIRAGTITSDISLAATFRAGPENGAHSQISPTGMEAWSALRQIFDVDVNDESAFLFGMFEATAMTILDRLALRGTNNEFSKGSRTMLASATSKPQNQPTVSIGYRNRQAPSFYNPANFFKASDGNWYSGSRFFGTGKVHKIVEGGDASLQWDGFDSDQVNPFSIPSTPSGDLPNGQADPYSVAEAGGKLYTLCHYAASSSDLRRWRINRYDLATKTLEAYFWFNLPSVNIPKFLINGTTALICQVDHTDSNRFKLHQINGVTTDSTGSKTVSSTFYLNDFAGNPWASTSSTTPVGSFQRTTSDLGADSWVMTRGDNEVAYVFNVSDRNMVANKLFPTGATDKDKSLFFDGTRWVSVENGIVRYLSGHYWTDAAWNNTQNWWVAHSWVDLNAGGTGTHETEPSEITKFVMGKRQTFTVSFPQLPAADATEPLDSVTGVRAYFKRNNVSKPATTALRRAATEIPNGVISKEYYTNPGTTIDETGSAPPVSGNFPANSPARIEDGANGYWSGDGNASWNEGGQVSLTTRATPTSTTNVALAGLTANLVSPGTGAVWEVELHLDVAASAAGQSNFVELLLDGAAQPIIATAGAVRVPASKKFRITGLSAGTHTLAARTRSAGAYTTNVYEAFTYMTWNRKK